MRRLSLPLELNAWMLMIITWTPEFELYASISCSRLESYTNA